jgi:hypothetical protein
MQRASRKMASWAAVMAAVTLVASCSPSALLTDDRAVGAGGAGTGGSPGAGGIAGGSGAPAGQAGSAGQGGASSKYGCPTVCHPTMGAGCGCVKDVNGCYRLIVCTPPAAPCGAAAVLCTDDGTMTCDFTRMCDPTVSDCRDFCEGPPPNYCEAGGGAPPIGEGCTRRNCVGGICICDCPGDGTGGTAGS